MTRRFWPPAEAAQADYEELRAAVLARTPAPLDVLALRFERRGLAGIIARPESEPAFEAMLVAGRRERWSPYADARLEALAAGYALLLGHVVQCAMEEARG